MRRPNDEGQSILELAILMPLMMLFIMTALQFALVAFAYLGLTNATREAIRWIALHPDTIDTVTTATIKSGVPSTLDPAKVSVVITPACSALTSGKCPNRDAGAQLSVSLTYDATTLALFPGLVMPTLTPSYTMYMRAEPR